MTDCAELFVKRNVVRFALTGLVGIWLSGCSADTSRFAAGSNPFASGNPCGNPFSTASNDAAAPTPRVASTPLASANPNYVTSAHPNPVAVSALPATAPATTGQIHSPASQPVGGSAVGWTAMGGSPVIVAEGDSLNSLSQRYGVPAAALMSANGLNSPAQVHGGMRIVVPVYNSRGRTEATPVAMARESSPEASTARAARKADREVAEASDDAARSKAKKKVEREAAEASDDAARSKAKKKVEREAADASDDAAKSKAKKKVEREAADASADAAKSKAKKKVEREAADASADAAKSKAKKKVEREAADASADAAKSKAKKKVAETVKTPAHATTTVAKLEHPKTARKKGA